MQIINVIANLEIFFNRYGSIFEEVVSPRFGIKIFLMITFYLCEACSILNVGFVLPAAKELKLL